MATVTEADAPTVRQDVTTEPANPTFQRREPVRVMHVVYALQPGGMEFGVVKVVNGLDPSRVRSSICSTVPAVGSMKELVSPHIPVFELRRRQGNDPKLVLDLYKLFRKERPDIVHTHAWGTLIEGVVAARLAGVSCVIHGEHGTLQLRGYQRRIQRWAWERTTRVLSVSKKLSERMAHATGIAPDRILTIQNGVDFSRFSPHYRDAARVDLGLVPDMFAIGTAGRLVPVKDHANLIGALARLRNQGRRFKAFIAGEGPLRRQIEELIAERELKAHVELLGQRRDIERVFAALDVFVLPSKSEGMSNTILEAMASGTPVVATNVGGAEELVEHDRTGLLVPSENSDALAAALVQMATDPDRRRAMGVASRYKASTEFSLQRMLDDYDRLYVETAAGSSRQGASA